MIEMLKILCGLDGVSGYEDNVRDYITARAANLADSVEIDRMGNVIVRKHGHTAAKLMLCAHMDEVGVIITAITDKGLLRFDFLGGVDRRVVLGKRVYIGPDRVPGVFGSKHHHFTEKSEGIPKTDALYIDIGSSGVFAAVPSSSGPMPPR